MSSSGEELLISADSHVIEDHELWVKRLPAHWKDEAPVFPAPEVGQGFQAHQGGRDPKVRVEEMAVDGVSQEILYPSFALNLFGMTNAALQEACFQVYNDWLVEYCSAASNRLFGIATISTFDIDHAVRELQRCKEAGLVGACVWEVPPDDLSFATAHYDPLWEAAEALEMPINLHILSGMSYPWPRPPFSNPRPFTYYIGHANDLVHEASSAIGSLMATGVLERFPELQFVIVESEASWIPFILTAYDKYAERSIPDSPLTMPPSDYFRRNFHATFFNDPTLSPILNHWGTENCMWSNDFPHPNSTWPDSRNVIERDLGHLPEAARKRLLSENVAELYSLPSLVSAV